MSRFQELCDRLNGFRNYLTWAAREVIDSCDQGGLEIFAECEDEEDIERVASEVIRADLESDVNSERKFRVHQEYLDIWTFDIIDELIINSNELLQLSNEWGVLLTKLMDQVEEI